jgi:hypothetical protein
MPGYPFDIFHHLTGTGKHMIVYPLMGIPDLVPLLIPSGHKGIVNVSPAHGNGGLKFPVNHELAYYVLQTGCRVVHDQ